MTRNPHFTPIRTRQLVIEKYLNGDTPKAIANRYDISEYCVNKYIRRYANTGSALTEYEIKKKNKEQITLYIYCFI